MTDHKLLAAANRALARWWASRLDQERRVAFKYGW